jgi:hypothetical protein
MTTTKLPPALIAEIRAASERLDAARIAHGKATAEWERTRKELQTATGLVHAALAAVISIYGGEAEAKEPTR